MFSETINRTHPKQILAVLSLSVLLAACATSPEDCDPRKVDSAIKSAMCGSSFKKGKEQREARVASLEQDIQLEQSQVNALDAEAAQLASDSAALESRISNLQSDMETAKSRLDRTITSSQQSKDDLAAAQDQLKELESQVSKLQGSATDEKEIAAILKDIEERKRLINGLVSVDVF